MSLSIRGKSFGAVRAAGLAVGLIALALVVVPATAGAATYTTQPITLACTSSGSTVSATATVTTTAPAAVLPGQTFTPTVQVGLALPASLYTQLSSFGLSSVTLNLTAVPVDALNATPASLNWYSTGGTAANGVTVTTASAPPEVNIPSTPITEPAYTVTGAAGSDVNLTVDPTASDITATAVSSPLSINITCTPPTPAAVIATIPIVAPPTVTSVSPTSGPTAGGNTVTVSGTGFAAGDTVDFGSNPGTNVSVSSDGTSLTVTAPAGTAGTTDVTVIDPTAGVSATSTADQYTYTVVCAQAPAITTQPVNTTVNAPGSATFTAVGSTPAGCSAPTVQWSVSTDGGNTFAPVSGATAASLSTGATTTSQSGTEYEATFTNAIGSTTTTPAVLTVNPSNAPSVTSVSPNKGVPNTIAFVYGSNLTRARAVYFGTHKSAFALPIGQRLLVLVPTPTKVGAVDVTVVSSIGTSPVTTADKYTYTAL